MNLHLDTDAFKTLIDIIHESTGYRTDVLEKDYYVSLILKELSDKQKEGLPAYFKGGTALYKALKTTNRFSEDIDLSIDSRECSGSQNKKRLETATKKYTSLERDNSQGRTNRDEIISVYQYEPITPYDKDDALQRFGLLKIEATSFTISEPVDELEVAPMIYDLATLEQKKILEEKYNVQPFKIQTISIERIFIDKLFATESYTRRSDEPHRAFEAAKHIYDLAVMSSHPRIVELLSDESQMKKLLDIRMREELSRHDGIPNILPKDFIFFDTITSNKNISSAYEIMQKQYVLREQDKIDYSKARKMHYHYKNY